VPQLVPYVMLEASALEANLSRKDALMAQQVMLVRINVHHSCWILLQRWIKTCLSCWHFQQRS